MPTKSTIRRVHAWASARTAPNFLYREVAHALMIPRPTVVAALEELEVLGLASDQEEGCWTVIPDSEALERALAAMEDTTAPPKSEQPLKPIERVRDVFEYAERCAPTGE